MYSLNGTFHFSTAICLENVSRAMLLINGGFYKLVAEREIRTDLLQTRRTGNGRLSQPIPQPFIIQLPDSNGSYC